MTGCSGLSVKVRQLTLRYVTDYEERSSKPVETALPAQRKDGRRARELINGRFLLPAFQVTPLIPYISVSLSVRPPARPDTDSPVTTNRSHNPVWLDDGG
jgi:hypothetical protein